MKLEKIILDEQKNTSLTAYVLDCGGELSNTDTRPAVLVLPGGGYINCSDREAEPVAMAFLNEGYHAFVLKYTTGKNVRWPEPLRDAEDAMRLIRSNSARWHVDAGRVAVIGFSAGGHLAAALGVLGAEHPNAMILGYPCILQTRMDNDKLFPGLDGSVSRDAPPTFVFATCNDRQVPVENTIRFIEKLDEHQVPFECHIYGNGVHGLSLAKTHTCAGVTQLADRRVAQWFPNCIEWLKETWGDFKTGEQFQFHIMADQDQEFYSVENSVGLLLENKSCHEVILRYLPVLGEESLPPEALAISLQMMLDYQPDILTMKEREDMNQELMKIRRK
ncbi:MAG: alpha/beta hydrolase [Clostridiales bacterium]|nr:alpha/beta hydrolase [Clostridiales bacterium]